MKELLGLVTQLTVGIGAAIGAITQFVAALNPAVMQVFNDALQNVFATVGQAVLPVVENLTKYLYDLSGILDPLMKSLAPIFDRLTQAFIALVEPVIQLIADFADFLTPAIDFFVRIIQMAADNLKFLVTLIDVLMKQLFAFIKNLFGGMEVKDITDLLQQFAKALYLAIGQLLKMVGPTDTLKSLIKSLETSPEAVRNRAPQDFATKGFQQILNEVQLASAQAGAGVDTKTQDQYMQEIIDGLKKIESGQSNWTNIIAAGLEKWASSSGKTAGQSIKAFGNSTVGRIISPGVAAAAKIME